MSRWEPGAAERLAEAALDLYLAQGFEQTTVADIAARAGLSERTYFRHFPDKREVLFAGSDQFQALMVAAVADAPFEASALEAVSRGLLAAGELLQGREGFAKRRQRVIAANAELLERELSKMSRLSSALASALRARGVDEPAATLAADAGLAAFRVAFETWCARATARSLKDLIESALRELEKVIA